MSERTEHLDQALAGEFAGKASIIHTLKIGNTRFAALLTRNHVIWKQIQQIEKGIDAVDDAVLQQLQKQRLVILDEIANYIIEAEENEEDCAASEAGGDRGGPD